MQIYLRKDLKKHQKRMKKWDEEVKEANQNNHCGKLGLSPSSDLWENLYNMS